MLNKVFRKYIDVAVAEERKKYSVEIEGLKQDYIRMTGAYNSQLMRNQRMVSEERERCAKIADAEAALSLKGGPMSSIAEDHWGGIAARRIALKIREKT